MDRGLPASGYTIIKLGLTAADGPPAGAGGPAGAGPGPGVGAGRPLAGPAANGGAASLLRIEDS